MNRLKSKLTSQSGASITYALLLFLVCAVVGSIVLAAGTAASGRMSGAVSSDQRYYSVTSAAKLLKNKLDGHSNRIVYTGTGSEFYSGTGNVIDTSKATKKTFDGKEVLPDPLGIMDYGSAVVGGWLSASTDPLKYDLTVKDTTDSSVKCSVKVSLSIVQSGSVPVLLLSVSNSDTTEGTYTLELNFTANVEETIGKKEINGVVTYECTRKITWNYNSVKTVAATASTEVTGG